MARHGDRDDRICRSIIELARRELGWQRLQEAAINELERRLGSALRVPLIPDATESEGLKRLSARLEELVR
jgi:hypothetical protein